MMTEIIIALISSAGGVIVGLVGVFKSNSLIAYKVDQLAEHVEKHNKLIDRTYNLERLADVRCEQINHINQKISCIEEELKK